MSDLDPFFSQIHKEMADRIYSTLPNTLSFHERFIDIPSQKVKSAGLDVIGTVDDHIVLEKESNPNLFKEASSLLAKLIFHQANRLQDRLHKRTTNYSRWNYDPKKIVDLDEFQILLKEIEDESKKQFLGVQSFGQTNTLKFNTYIFACDISFCIKYAADFVYASKTGTAMPPVDFKPL